MTGPARIRQFRYDTITGDHVMKSYQSTMLRNLALLSLLAFQGLSMSAGAAVIDAQDQIQQRILNATPAAELGFVAALHRPAPGQDPHAFAREHLGVPALWTSGGPGAVALDSQRLPTFNAADRLQHGILH